MNEENANRFRPRVLGLDEEFNAEFYKIVNEHKIIVDDWNRINIGIIKIKKPIIWLFGYKKKIEKYLPDLLALENNFINWYKRSGEFLYKPNLEFTKNQEKEIGFIHFTNVLRDLRNNMNWDMRLIRDNYNRRYDDYHNQCNFFIAISSFILTFMGLVATLYTLIVE